jgi:hypothetical protein
MGFRANESAPPLRRDNKPLSLQTRNRPAHRGTARPVVVRQLVLGREAFPCRPAPVHDLSAKLANDPLVRERLSSIGHNLMLQVGAEQAVRGEAQALFVSGDHAGPRAEYFGCRWRSEVRIQDAVNEC